MYQVILSIYTMVQTIQVLLVIISFETLLRKYNERKDNGELS